MAQTIEKVKRGSRESAIDRMVDYLGQAIEAGEYREGDRLPSRSELSKQFGIHPGTAGVALKRLGEKLPLKFVMGKGVFVASAEQEAHTISLGVLGRFASLAEHEGILSDSYAGALLKNLILAGQSLGCHVGFIPNSDQLPLDMDYIASFDSDCAIMLGLPKDAETILEFKRRKIPLILDRPGDGSVATLGMSFVRDVTLEIIRRSARMFYEQGHRRIAMVAVDSTDASGERWRKEFYAQCVEAGFSDVPRDSFRLLSYKNLSEHLTWVGDEVLALLDQPNPPTAIYCRTLQPQSVQLIAQKLADRGLVLGQDISLVAESVKGVPVDVPVSMFVHDYATLMRSVVEAAITLADEPWHVFCLDIPLTFDDRGSVARIG